MCTVLKIPGVTLEVFKQNRQLVPESDGYVGQLYSGQATILAVIDQDADVTVGIFRQGNDHYQKLWNWLVDPAQIPAPTVQAQQQKRQEFLGDRNFVDGSSVYGVKIPLRVWNHNGHPVNTVHYPENMLALAQYKRDAGQLTGRVHVWEVALVSQNGEFFLTVHRHYNIPACRSVSTGRICFPRLQKHRLLERILVDNAPSDIPLVPAEDIVPVERAQVQNLGRYEGIVENWYAPRNMGCIVTAQGSARVHWSNVPPRPRLRFLKEGERVKFAELRVPPENPKTEWRKVRKARFKLEACGIEVNGV